MFEMNTTDNSSSELLNGAAVYTLIKIVGELKQAPRDEDDARGGFLCEYFTATPKDGDYKKIISHVMTLTKIQHKLERNEYRSFEEIECDFALMSDNARRYNTQRDTTIPEDCEVLRREFYKLAHKNGFVKSERPMELGEFLEAGPPTSWLWKPHGSERPSLKDQKAPTMRDGENAAKDLRVEVESQQHRTRRESQVKGGATQISLSDDAKPSDHLQLRQQRAYPRRKRQRVDLSPTEPLPTDDDWDMRNQRDSEEEEVQRLEDEEMQRLDDEEVQRLDDKEVQRQDGSTRRCDASQIVDKLSSEQRNLHEAHLRLADLSMLNKALISQCNEADRIAESKKAELLALKDSIDSMTDQLRRQQASRKALETTLSEERKRIHEMKNEAKCQRDEAVRLERALAEEAIRRHALQRDLEVEQQASASLQSEIFDTQATISEWQMQLRSRHNDVEVYRKLHELLLQLNPQFGNALTRASAVPRDPVASTSSTRAAATATGAADTYTYAYSDIGLVPRYDSLISNRLAVAWRTAAGGARADGVGGLLSHSCNSCNFPADSNFFDEPNLSSSPSSAAATNQRVEPMEAKTRHFIKTEVNDAEMDDELDDEGPLRSFSCSSIPLTATSAPARGASVVQVYSTGLHTDPFLDASKAGAQDLVGSESTGEESSHRLSTASTAANASAVLAPSAFSTTASTATAKGATVPLDFALSNTDDEDEQSVETTMQEQQVHCSTDDIAYDIPLEILEDEKFPIDEIWMTLKRSEPRRWFIKKGTQLISHYYCRPHYQQRENSNGKKTWDSRDEGEFYWTDEHVLARFVHEYARRWRAARK